MLLYSIIMLELFSLSSDGTKNVSFKFIKNAGLTAPTYNDISTNTSVVDFDIVGTAPTGGTLALPIKLQKVDGETKFIKDLDILLNPGETMTITALSANASDVEVGIVWIEDF